MCAHESIDAECLLQGAGSCVGSGAGLSLPSAGCELRAQPEVRQGRGLAVVSGGASLMTGETCANGQMCFSALGQAASACCWDLVAAADAALRNRLPPAGAPVPIDSAPDVPGYKAVLAVSFDFVRFPSFSYQCNDSYTMGSCMVRGYRH